MKSGLLLNVIVGERAAIFKLLTSKDEALLIRRNTLLILNLGLHSLDTIRRLDFERDRLASEGLHEDLHASTETQDEVESGLLLDVVV